MNKHEIMMLYYNTVNNPIMLVDPNGRQAGNPDGNSLNYAVYTYNGEGNHIVSNYEINKTTKTNKDGSITVSTTIVETHTIILKTIDNKGEIGTSESVVQKTSTSESDYKLQTWEDPTSPTGSESGFRKIGETRNLKSKIEHGITSENSQYQSVLKGVREFVGTNGFDANLIASSSELTDIVGGAGFVVGGVSELVKKISNNKTLTSASKKMGAFGWALSALGIGTYLERKYGNHEGKKRLLGVY